MVVVKLLIAGVPRVMGGKAGMTFIVDSFTNNPNGKVVHVRDYRYDLITGGRGYAIWSIGPDGYEIIYPIQLDEAKALIKQIFGTAETGLDLVKVARDAHNAEQELISVKRDLELYED